jgi:hypothetical protein
LLDGEFDAVSEDSYLRPKVDVVLGVFNTWVDMEEEEDIEVSSANAEKNRPIPVA